MLDKVNTSIQSNNAEVPNCQFLVLDNVLEELKITILVSGRPPVRIPLPGAAVLYPEGGSYYRDKYAARFPVHLMNQLSDSSFEPSMIDVFGCGSTLSDTLCCPMGPPQRFSFTVDVIGKTTFFPRRTHPLRELIDSIHGYGQHFYRRTQHAMET